MPNVKKIKSQISSVSNIQKITKALEIVSTVKLQKIKKKTENYRDFMINFLDLLNIVKDKIDIFKHDTINHEWTRLLVVVSSDKGLCGGLNSKLFKHIFEKYNKHKSNVEVFCVGKKAFEFFVRAGFNVVGYISLKDDFVENDLISLYKYVQDGLAKKNYGKIKLYFNYFKSIMSQVPLRFKLFPIDVDTFDSFAENLGFSLDKSLAEGLENKELLIEPDMKEFKKELSTQLIQYMIYGSVLQNKAGEFAARMLAMKNAKDNSEEIINYLKLSFNKARQTIITQEVSEIMGAKMAIDQS